MRIPDYKKRAALAAENWNRLQAQKKPAEENTDSKKDILSTLKDQNQSIEQTVVELIDDMVVPTTTVKGIHIVKEQEIKEELHKTA